MINNEFKLDGYTIVRSELFTSIQEPVLTFNNNQLYINKVCHNELNNSHYIKILQSEDNTSIAILPCDKNSFQAISVLTPRNKLRKMSCKKFFKSIIDTLQWDNHLRYRIKGTVCSKDDLTYIVFDLLTAEKYVRGSIKKKEGVIKNEQ